LGCSLAELAGKEGLPWRDARPILLDLAEELTASCTDGTLPEALAIEQVWIQPDGSAHLVDVLAPPARAAASTSIDASPLFGEANGNHVRALGLLFQTAGLALEGGRRGKHGDHAPIHAAIPEHIARLLDRLNGASPPVTDVAAFLAELRTSEGRPTEVDASMR